MATGKSKRRSKKSLKSVLLMIAVAVIVVACSYFGVFEKLGIDFGGQKDVPVTEDLEGLFQVHMIDVGQADCFLLRIPDGDSCKTVLIDAGLPNDVDASSGSKTIINYLISQGVDKIDYFFISHPHTDHYKGALNVMKKFKTSNFVMPDCDYSVGSWTNLLSYVDEQNINVIFADKDAQFSIGDADVKILAPSAKMLKDDDANNFSIVAKFTYKNNSFMFTGDARKESEAEMLKSYSAQELKCDVLKIGHHGSSTSSSPNFIKAVDPLIGLMSLGKNNGYGHPHKKAMETITQQGMTLYRTDELGTVVIVSDGKTVSRYENTKK